MSFRFERYLVAALLVLYWLMAVTASLHKSNAFDEMAHLTGGYSYFVTGEYRLHPENGVLPQKWSALPLTLMSAKFPSTNQPSWWHSSLWNIGFQFFFQVGNDIDRLLLASRGMIALLGMGLGLIVYLWSKSLFGKTGAFISLLLFVFCPHMLAHGALVTSDLSAALFLIASVWALWKLTGRVTPSRIVIAGLCMSGLILSKATSLTLMPIIFLMIVARGALGFRLGKMRTAIFSVAGVIAIAFFLIWSFYDFRFSAFLDPIPEHRQFTYSWDQVLAHPVAPVFRALRDYHVLPEAYVFGTSLNFASLRSRGGFINGNYSYKGFWYYFPYCFLVKTPIAFFIILVIAAFLTWRRPIDFERTAPLWIMLAVYWFFAITSHVDIGHRYLLPVYPALYILAGSSATALKRPNHVWKYLLVASLVWFACESYFIRPNYLAYFNEFIGGPRQGYKHLVDSSLDWGQDLPALEDWLGQNNADQQRVYLAYFGTASPQYYGIDALPLRDSDPNQPIPTLKSGIYCISATLLQTMYTTVIGPWALPYEKNYQQLLHKSKQLQGQLTGRDSIDFQDHRFSRLCAYLRKRNPDAQAAYSILIYRLSDSDLDKALYGPPAQLTPEIEIKGLINGKIPPFL